MEQRELTVQILQDRLTAAQKRFRSASAKFQTVVDSVPSGIPHPDGSLRLMQASQEHEVAMRAYTEALGHFTDFLTKGVVPKDL